MRPKPSFSLIRQTLLYWLSFCLLAVATNTRAQDAYTPEEIQAMRIHVNEVLHMGQVDTIRYYANMGRQMALRMNDAVNSSYFSYILGTTYRYTEPEVTRIYFDTALVEAGKVDYEIVEMLVNNGMASLTANLGQLDSALYYHAQSLEILERQPDSKKKSLAMASYLNNVAMIYRDMGDYAQAMDKFLQAYELNIENDNLNKAHFALYNLANTYKKLGKLEEAENTYKNLQLYADTARNIQLDMMANMGLASVYIARYRDEQGLDYYRRALSLSAQNRSSGHREILTAISNTFLQLNFADSAQFYLDEAAKLVTPENDRYFINHNLIRAGIGLLTGELEAARQAALLATEKSREIHTPSMVSEGLKLLSDIAVEQQDYASSLDYFKEYTSIQDSLLDVENRESLLYSDLKLKSKLNNQKISSLEKLADSQKVIIYRKNELIIITLALSALALVLFFIAYRTRLRAAANKETLSRIKLANAQLNPHFLFNSLGAIQQLVLEKENELMISNYIAKFSKLTRDMLNYTECESIPLQQELNFLNNYLSLQALRFNNSFEYEINVPDDMETELIYVPPLITQPFVENTLEHAFEKNQEDNKLIVNVAENGIGIKIIVEDNGVGINKTLNIKKSDKHSMAIEMTRGRLKFWSKKTGKAADVSIDDLSHSSPGMQGTRVTLNLPYL